MKISNARAKAFWGSLVLAELLGVALVFLACSSQSLDRHLQSGRLTLPEFFTFAARDLGVQGVELEDKHLQSTDEEYLLTLKGQALRLGLTIVNIAFMNNFGLPTSAERRAEFSRAVKWMSYARSLGSPRLRVCAGWPHNGDRSLWRPAVTALQDCCDRANEYSMTIVTENHNHGGFLRTGADVLRLFGDVNRRNLKLLLDTGNYADGLPSIKSTAYLTGHVHAKAYAVAADGSEPRINYPAVLSVLRGLRYEGAVSMEYEGEQEPFDVLPRFSRYLQGLGNLRSRLGA